MNRAIEKTCRALTSAALLAAFVMLALVLFSPAAAFADDLTIVDGSGEAVKASGASINDDGDVAVSEEADVALLTGSSFGLSDFGRQNKGKNWTVEDVYYGYGYRLLDERAFCAIVNQDYVIVYIPQDTLDALGIDITDANFQKKFLVTLVGIDKAASNGGYTIEESAANASVYFTSGKMLAVGDYTYEFGVEIGEGKYYATSVLKGSADGSDGALYASTGHVTAAAETVVAEQATGLAALGKFFQKLDWRPLWVSLRTTGVAIVVIFILGLLAAWLTLRVSNRVKGVLDTIFTIPMVLPPTVCGFILLMVFGSGSDAGKWFIEHGLNLAFTWPAAVIACIVVGFPMMYRTVRGAFESIDANMLDAARTLGWKEGGIFLRIMMPLSWPSIAAGIVLAFARAMGEFGCTLFFAGNTAGVTQTIPLAIYFDWMGGEGDQAIFWAIVVIIISFLVILFVNIYSSKTQRYRKRLGE